MNYIAKKKKKKKRVKMADVKISPKQIERVSKKINRMEERFSKFSKNVDKIRKDVRRLISETRVLEPLHRDIDRCWDYSHDLGQKQNEIRGITNVLTKKQTQLLQTFEDKIKATHEGMNKFEGNLKKDVKSMASALTKKQTQLLQTFEDEIKTTHERMNKFEDDLKSVRRLPSFYKDVNEKVSELEKQYNHIASNAMAKIEELEDTIHPDEEKMHKIVDLDTVKDQVESIRKSMLTFNKLWADYKKTIDERVGLRPTQVAAITPESVSLGMEDELKSLRDIVNKLSLENEQIKKMARDIRVSQMGVPGTEVMTNLTRRLSTIEKKIAEVEQGMNKSEKINPIVLE